MCEKASSGRGRGRPCAEPVHLSLEQYRHLAGNRTVDTLEMLDRLRREVAALKAETCKLRRSLAELRVEAERWKGEALGKPLSRKRGVK